MPVFAEMLAKAPSALARIGCFFSRKRHCYLGGLPCKALVMQHNILIAHDRDNNLVDEKVTFYAYQAILSKFGINLDVSVLQKAWSGQRYNAAFRNFEQTFGIKLGNYQKLFEKTVIDLQERYESVLPEVPSVLQLIATAGINQVVVTNNSRRVAENGFRLCGLQALLPSAKIYSGDDVTAHKPAPEIYLLAMASEGCSPANTVAIEDSVAGMQAATAAQVRVRIANLSIHHLNGAVAEDIAQAVAQLRKAGATHFAHGYGDVWRIIQAEAGLTAQGALLSRQPAESSSWP